MKKLQCMRPYIFSEKRLQIIYNIIVFYNICMGVMANTGLHPFFKTHKLDDLCNISLTGGDTASHACIKTRLFWPFHLSSVLL